MYAFFRWIVLSCEAGMHIASFQDGNVPLPDLEYAKGRSLTTTLLLLHNCFYYYTIVIVIVKLVETPSQLLV